MFAIVEVASRQYKLSVGDTIYVPISINGKELSLDRVAMTVSGKDVAIGTPYLKDTKVVCDVLGVKKGKKTVIVKFRKRKDYHLKKGHRDILTCLKVKDIVTKTNDK